MLSKAWEEPHLASNSEGFSVNEYEGVAYVAFPSFHKIEGFIANERKYGEWNIQNNKNVFFGCLKGDDGQPTTIHQGALKLFLHVMENTYFQEKVNYFF